MIAPHINPHFVQEQDIEQDAEAELERNGLYLVPAPNSDASMEGDRVKYLEEKVRQLHKELSDLTSLLFRKEQLLHNFRIREQELKASFFQAAGENKNKLSFT